jgi:hypothetical protein
VNFPKQIDSVHVRKNFFSEAAFFSHFHNGLWGGRKAMEETRTVASGFKKTFCEDGADESI